MKPHQVLEKDYWCVVEGLPVGEQRSNVFQQVEVDYLKEIDVDQLEASMASGRPSEGTADDTVRAQAQASSSSSRWKLDELRTKDGNIFKYVQPRLSGINTPWIYFGNLFATFCWHTEDNYFASINLHHAGPCPPPLPMLSMFSRTRAYFAAIDPPPLCSVHPRVCTRR